jgi:hypothetical protein
VLLFGGRPVAGFGLDAVAPTTFLQAGVDLQNQVLLVVGAGDAYYTENLATFDEDYSDAVLAYQAAGQAGATSLGPEIDSAGAPTVTKPLTKQAWTINGQLQAISKSGLPVGTTPVYWNKTDADAAKILISKMVGLYTAAILNGSIAVKQPVPSPTAAPVASPAATSGPSALPVIALGTAVAAVAAVMITRSSSWRRSHG